MGIDGQKDAGMGIADGAHNFEIFARFDLKFDALITGAKLNFDSFKKHLGSGFEPYGDTAFDFRLRAAKQSGERENFRSPRGPSRDPEWPQNYVEFPRRSRLPCQESGEREIHG